MDISYSKLLRNNKWGTKFKWLDNILPYTNKSFDNVYYFKDPYAKDQKTVLFSSLISRIKGDGNSHSNEL